METSPPTGRPVVRGLPVPYVAAWTDEHWHRLGEPDSLIPIEVNGHLLISYRDERPGDRDPEGALWIRNGLGGGGEPEFGQINAPRYRRCVTRCRCQVCGAPVSRSGTPWVVPEHEWPGTPGAPLITTNPPTCGGCRPVALRLCPHLRRGARALTVTEWRRYGVQGDVYHPAEGGVAPEPVPQWVPYGDRPRLARTLAKQQLILLDRYSEVEE